MSWSTVVELLTPVVTYVLAYFIHRPKKTPAP